MKSTWLFIISGILLLGCNNNTQSSSETKKDLSKMTFKKAGWINNTDVYEVNLRQYSKEGTFNAFLEELPRLKEMGVSTLWFMPITPIAQKNKKGSLGSQYACSDYTAINPEFGTLEDFKQFVKKAHDMGFKVIIDWVANHTGWDHVWTKTYPDYFEKDSATNDFKVASGMDDIIELDYKNPALRKAMIDAMKYWVTECDIDGYRCDLAFWVELDFWLEARTELEKIKTLFWLAENDPLDNPSYYQAFDACYTWTWMHKTEEFYKNSQDIKILDTVLHRYDSVGGKDGIKLWFTTNHDENSWNGTEYEKYGDAAKAFAVHSFTWGGIPLIYNGQELPNMKRLKFFDKDVIEWDGKNQLHDFYKTLSNLRKTNPALRAGDETATTTRLKTNAANNVIAYLRKNGQREVLVLLNMSKQMVHCLVEDEQLTGNFTDVFSKSNHDFTAQKSFDMQPWAYLVYEK
ncbi:MAG: alpha amylase C-terminal domain-containing protein [Ferruginibacter sp.]|nr:alpha amylase C-terminal domain-containing protein [Ferruginibacter sp.]